MFQHRPVREVLFQEYAATVDDFHFGIEFGDVEPHIGTGGAEVGAADIYGEAWESAGEGGMKGDVCRNSNKSSDLIAWTRNMLSVHATSLLVVISNPRLVPQVFFHPLKSERALMRCRHVEIGEDIVRRDKKFDY